MKKKFSKKSLILICVGLFWLAFSQVLFYYISITDTLKGGLLGIGIGLLLIALFIRKRILV
jgi:membrane-associated phospholipid phosphatase